MEWWARLPASSSRQTFSIQRRLQGLCRIPLALAGGRTHSPRAPAASAGPQVEAVETGVCPPPGPSHSRAEWEAAAHPREALRHVPPVPGPHAASVKGQIRPRSRGPALPTPTVRNSIGSGMSEAGTQHGRPPGATEDGGTFTLGTGDPAVLKKGVCGPPPSQELHGLPAEVALVITVNCSKDSHPPLPSLPEMGGGAALRDCYHEERSILRNQRNSPGSRLLGKRWGGSRPCHLGWNRWPWVGTCAGRPLEGTSDQEDLGFHLGSGAGHLPWLMLSLIEVTCLWILKNNSPSPQERTSCQPLPWAVLAVGSVSQRIPG